MNLKLDFQPSHIVCLDERSARLYAEVIQIVADRQVAWVRPIALLEAKKEADLLPQAVALDSDQLNVYDLRQGADLLCPLSLFRTGLDTEVIPVLMALGSPKTETDLTLASASHQSQHRQLQAFLRRLWQENPNAFQ
jgi:hypothetical protein